MSDSVLLLLACATVAAALLAWLGTLAHRARLAQMAAEQRLESRETELVGLRESLAQSREAQQGLQDELGSRREELARLRASLELERKHQEQRLADLNDSKAQLTDAFKNLANEIFEDKSRKFTDTSRQSLATLLNPLQERIGRFEKRVEETYQQEARERHSLAKEIKGLQELNVRISEEAVNLTNALKGDNKAQGSWGEFVLESILEKSGLVKGREYEVQVNLSDGQGGKFQPDVVVHLPESRDIIIDSKVSLKAWDELHSCDDETRRAELLKNHIQSLRLHVRGLAAKDYQNLVGVNSLDYVFLFMPIEAAWYEAARQDPSLFQDAFDRNIIIVVPSTLLTTLKTVQNLWRLAQQNQNAAEIARKAGDLYDKFVNFVADLEEIGQRIEASRKSYDKAFNKLKSGRGNLIRRVETLKELGAKTSKRQQQALVEAAEDAEHQALAAAQELDPAEPEKESEDDGDGDQKTHH